MNTGAFVFSSILLLSALVGAEEAATISSLDQAVSLLTEAQEDWWKLAPPDFEEDAPPYIHPDSTVRIVDWMGDDADWPTNLLQNVYAALVPAGESGSEYPFYSMVLTEERDGTLVFYNLYGVEMYRQAAAEGYMSRMRWRLSFTARLRPMS